MNKKHQQHPAGTSWVPCVCGLAEWLRSAWGWPGTASPSPRRRCVVADKVLSFHCYCKELGADTVEGRAPWLNQSQRWPNTPAHTASTRLGSARAGCRLSVCQWACTRCPPPKNRARELPRGARTGGPSLGDILLWTQMAVEPQSRFQQGTMCCSLPSTFLYLLPPAARVTPRSG